MGLEGSSVSIRSQLGRRSPPSEEASLGVLSMCFQCIVAFPMPPRISRLHKNLEGFIHFSEYFLFFDIFVISAVLSRTRR